MIKVNLLHQSLPVNRGSSENISAMDLSDDVVAQKEVQKQFLIRILVIILGPVGFYFYESTTISQLVAQEQQLIPQVQELRNFNADAANIKAEVEQFKADETKIQARIEALGKLSAERLNEIKILDFLQQVVPEKVWLSKLEFKSGEILIAGYASTNDEISKFQEVLTKSAFLKNVTLSSSKELLIETVTLKQFEISTLMEMVR